MFLLNNPLDVCSIRKLVYSLVIGLNCISPPPSVAIHNEVESYTIVPKILYNFWLLFSTGCTYPERFLPVDVDTADGKMT